MKKIILLFFLAYLQFNTYSQALLDTTNIWSVLKYSPEFYAIQDYQTTWYRLGSQLEIQNKNYYQLQYTTDSLHLNWIDTAIYLRKDNDIVYKYADNFEQKLYDFGLQKNDTLHYTNNGMTYISKVDSIRDTLLYNLQRKQFYISSFYSEDTTIARKTRWIEGIGSVESLLKDYCVLCTGGSYFKLLCMYSSEEIQYHDTAYSDCYYYFNTLAIKKHTSRYNKLDFFPNPIKEYLYFEIPDKIVRQIEIYNLLGQLEMRINSSEQKVHLSDLNAGLYYINITTIDNLKYSAKFVKN